MPRTGDPCLLACPPEAVSHLRRRDKKLGAFIDEAGPITRSVIPDVFQALVHTIAGQQISSKAQAAVWQKVSAGLAPLTFEHVSGLSLENLTGLGLSQTKARCVLNMARACAEGRLDLEALRTLPDSEVVSTLTALKGIGPWSAEMMLIFCLKRPNVLSFGDYGIRRGLRMLYGQKEITRDFFDKTAERWSPWGTIGSLYLWELASGRHAGYSDPAGR